MAGLRVKELSAVVVVLTCGLALLLPRATASNQPILKFSGGLWWDGEHFVAKTFYSVDGLLSVARPNHVDSVLELNRKFVVPPFADAHVHNLADLKDIDSDIEDDLTDGVFYAMEMDPGLEISPDVLRRVNKPDSVDVTYTQGLVTPSWGVMADMYTMLAQMGRFGERKTLGQVDTREVFIVDTESDLQQKWPALAARNHDFIKVIVAFSEEEATRRSNSRYGGKPPDYSAKAGIDPGVLEQLVLRAHAAGLRVAAHIETAADFRLALKSGVDIIAHLPAAWQIGAKTGFTDGSLEHWKLTKEDARLTAERGTSVVTTIYKKQSDPDVKQYREVYSHNLDLLARAGARLLLGTDMRGSISDEVLYIASLSVLDNRALLKALTETTPRAIFPSRKIGELRDGYEASFLALDSNPVQDLENIKRISLRVKQGHVIRPKGNASAKEYSFSVSPFPVQITTRPAGEASRSGRTR
jgi:Amidohydrolase family